LSRRSTRFAEITEKQFRRGVHRSTEELETAIRASIDAVNADPKPFRRTKSADDILAAIKRFRLKTLEIASAQVQIERNSESGHWQSLPLAPDRLGRD
jgi:hypothetical protein